MLFLRKCAFYIFLTAYLIVCPFIVLYALGYILKPAPSGSLVKTGDIYLATSPPGASVYVNKKIIDNKTPALLDKLLPGDYGVSIFLEKYRPWNYVVRVEAGGAKALDKILLIPKEWRPETLAEGNFANIISSPGADVFVVTGGAKIGDYSACYYKSGKTRPLVNEESPYAGYAVKSCFTARESGAFLFIAASGEKDLLLWVNLEDDTAEPQDITDLFPAKPGEVTWSAASEETIFAFQHDFINKIDISLEALYPRYVKKARGMGVLNGTLYVLGDDGTLYSTDFDDTKRVPILEDAGLGEQIFGKSGYFKILPFTGNIILFLGGKGELLSNHLPYRFVEGGVRGVRFYEAAGDILLWTKGKIGILDFAKEDTGGVFEKGPKLDWVYGEGSDIREAEWVYDGSHILFRDGSTVNLLALKGRDKPRLISLFPVKEKSSIFYSEDTGNFYYIDKETGALMALSIISPVKDKTKK